MTSHPQIAKAAFGLGMACFVYGVLVMCHCPWSFVIATVFFGGSWLLAVGRLRGFALAFFTASIAGAIYEAAAKQQFDQNVERLRQQMNAEYERAHPQQEMAK
jgi:hypothetical protein